MSGAEGLLLRKLVVGFEEGDLLTETLDLDSAEPKGLFIPVGVAHGFLTKTDIVLTYLVDNYYDGTDENAVAWNDPDIGIDWGSGAPTISQRDATSPRLMEIDSANLPK